MTTLDPRLLEILACPCQHHAPVAESDGAVVCQRCRTSFPITDGIPVMLLDQATPGPQGIGADVNGA
jgi:uncharacterized protein YbaR (Trm112 family)